MNPSYLILKSIAKVLPLSLDSLLVPDITEEDEKAAEMKMLYLNCPPEMRETLLHHTRGVAEELSDLSKKLEKE